MPLASILLGALVLGQVPPVAELELTDQYGNSDSLSAHRNHVVVAMVVTAKRLRNLKSWEKSLREHYEDVHFLRIADVPAEPSVTLDRVARKLRGRVPEDVPILIDVERHWAQALDLDTGRPNLLLIDRDGKLRAAFRGRSEPELLDEVQTAMKSLVNSK